jgi:hypothetical protein
MNQASGGRLSTCADDLDAGWRGYRQPWPEKSRTKMPSVTSPPETNGSSGQVGGTMRVTEKFLIGLALLFCFVPWQRAAALDSAELVTACADEQSQIRRGLCVGYISGVSETLTSVLQVSGICAPDAVTAEQVESVVRRYLDAHPEQMRKPAVAAVWSALVAAWPCPGMKRP